MDKDWAESQDRYWSRLARGYDSLYQSPWSQYEDDRLKERLESVFTSNFGIVVDLGCGTGLGYRLTSRISKDLEYIGCDISDEMLSTMQSSHPEIRTLKISIDDLGDLEENAYDYVLALNIVISLARDVPKTMRSIFRILKPNGYAFISVLNRFSLRRILFLRFGEIEEFSSRNAASAFGQIPAHAISTTCLKRIGSDSGFADANIWPQSVLAGVAECQALIPLDAWLLRVAPELAHCIYFEGRKPCI